MDQLMLDRGFKLCGGGTNRRAYQSLIDPGVVTKIATDNVGFTSNSRELINQHVIKPFCSKMFDVTRDGTVGLMECVVPIKTIMEYQKYADAIHDMLFFVFRNNDIGMEDIGTRSFKNIGFRNNFGPVVLDYPTMYLLDPNKRYCRAIINGVMCCGTLDYDEGYNSIVCTECGRTYFAKSLARKNGEDINLLMRAVGRSPQRKESNAMRIQIVDENGNTEREIQVSDKSGYVNPSRRRRIVDLNNPVMAQPKPAKTPKFTVFDVEPEKEETETPTTVETAVESEPVAIVNSAISDGNDTIRAALLNRHANVTIDELATAYNEALGQFKAVETSTLTPAQVWERVHQAMTKGVTCFKSKAEVIGLWQRLLAATMDIDRPNHFLINDLINMVCPAQSGDGLVDALYMIVNTIKNSIDLFEAIIVYHKTILELYSFETDETMNEIEYKIYRDLYLVYIETIRLLMNDFFTNVAFSGTLTYNAQNIVSIIGRYMSKIVQTADNEMGELDIDNYYDITIGDNFVVIFPKQRRNEEDDIVEPTTVIEESDAIEEREEPLEEIASNDSSDDDFDFSGDTLDVIPIDTANVPTENRMNRKQQNRYGNGNNKGGKHNKKNKHNKR